jgi:hypothetical protein
VTRTTFRAVVVAHRTPHILTFEGAADAPVEVSKQHEFLAKGVAGVTQGMGGALLQLEASLAGDSTR